MAVIVRLVTGEKRTYPDADAANLIDGQFVVSKYNKKKRHSESVQAFQAESVVLAEVLDHHGTIERIVLGKGRISS